MYNDQTESVNIGKSTYYIQQKFESKKNNVYLVTEGRNKNRVFVLKIFSEKFKGNYHLELRSYQKLNELGIPVPKMIESTDGLLLLEFIQGSTLMDKINEIIIDGTKILTEADLKELKIAFQALGNWFGKLHAKTLNKAQNSLLKGDCVLKNFIFNPTSKNDKIFGLDFEESIFGPPLLDLGSLAAMVLTIKPIFTEQNFILFNEFIQSYNQTIGELVKKDKAIDISTLDLAKYASEALISVAKWHSSDSAKELLIWADKFKSEKRIF